MKLLGAKPGIATGLEKQQGIVNYFIGNDPKQWRTNIPTYARAKLAGVYPGIDVVYYGQEPRAKSQAPRAQSHEQAEPVRSQLSALNSQLLSTISSSTPARTRRASVSPSRARRRSASPTAT